MVQKLRTTIRILLEQLEERGLESEIIVIDWSPPDNTPHLHEVLSLPVGSASVTIRSIVVSNRYHNRFLHSHLRSVHPSAALNVGIRRARGEFILPRMSDVFYSEPIVDFIAQKNLDRSCVYRSNRIDVDGSILEEASTDRRTFLDLCDGRQLRAHKPSSYPEYFDIPDLHADACGDFLLMSLGRWHGLRGWFETRDVADLDSDSLTLHAAVASGARQVVLPESFRVYKMLHSHVTERRTIRLRWTLLGACFLIMRIIGVPGRTELALRIRANYPRRRITTLGRVRFDSYERNFIARAQEWARGAGPILLNNDSWGLADEHLPEKVLCRASWDT